MADTGKLSEALLKAGLTRRKASSLPSLCGMVTTKGAALLVTILMFIAYRCDRVSATLFVPYAAWVAFASVLNASIVVLN